MAWWRRTRRDPPRGAPVALVLYTKADCGLCEAMKRAVEEARLPRPYELREVDIGTDPELVERFGRSIPVLEIAGRVAFKGRLEPAALRRKFVRLAAEADRGGSAPA